MVAPEFNLARYQTTSKCRSNPPEKYGLTGFSLVWDAGL
jgi:hypothetical protein